MNFDELWRQNLAPAQSPVYWNDEQEEVPRHRPPSERPNELNLTAEDCAFLSQGWNQDLKCSEPVREEFDNTCAQKIFRIFLATEKMFSMHIFQE
jgi:hypothetical protein